MADPLVAYSDLELFLVVWYRHALAQRPEDVCNDVEVDTVEPRGDFPRRMVIIRDDGGPDTSIAGAERAVGISVLAGSRLNNSDAKALARIVHALRTQIPQPGFAVTIDDVQYRNPVSAVLDSNGPYAVADDQDRSREYITLTLAVHPEPL